MILKQYYLGCLAHASYFVADMESKRAAVVDPQRDIDQCLAEAEKLEVEIRHVILTHFHADFLAGHLELRDRTGAAIHLGVRAEAEYGFEPAREGDVLDLGAEVRLCFLETPGHTPESVSVLVYDLAKAPERPHAVLTGDTLYIRVRPYDLRVKDGTSGFSRCRNPGPGAELDPQAARGAGGNDPSPFGGGFPVTRAERKPARQPGGAAPAPHGAVVGLPGGSGSSKRAVRR